MISQIGQTLDRTFRMVCQGIIDDQPACFRTDRPAMQSFQLIPHPTAIEVHLVPASPSHELIQRTLIVPVQEQIVDRLDGRTVTGDQSGDIFTEMFDLIYVGKDRPKMANSAARSVDILQLVFAWPNLTFAFLTIVPHIYIKIAKLKF
jgi:hypothetical protein